MTLLLFLRYEHYVGTYFWFMGDLFIVCFFATSFVSAYRYIHLRHKLELDNKTNRANEKQIQKVIQARIYKNVACEYTTTKPNMQSSRRRWAGGSLCSNLLTSLSAPC